MTDCLTPTVVLSHPQALADLIHKAVCHTSVEEAATS
jgi:hypothetical protein